MGAGDYRQGKKEQKHGPPREPRDIAIIGKLRALNRSPDKSPSPEKEDDGEHRLNERLLARWTKRLAILTGLLVLAGIIGDGLVFLTLQDTRDVSASQARDTQAALKLAGAQASAAADQASYAAVQAETAKAAVDTAQQDMVANGRAWVGPTNASIDKIPELGKPVTATVNYQNSGKEPARELFRDIQVEALVPSPAVDDKMRSNGNGCFSHAPGLDVTFPSTGGLGSGYSGWKDLASDEVTQDVIDGKKTIYVYGCFVYRTANLVRHTSFCYFFTNSKDAKIAALNICGLGVRAD